MSDSFSRSIRARLRSDDFDARRDALTQLHEEWDRVSIQASDLLPLLAEDDDASYRILAIQLLADLGEVEAVPALLQTLIDPDLEVADAAQEALREFRGRDALDALITGAEHAEPKIRAAALAALGALRHPRSVPTLRRASEDLSDLVRREAIVALSQFPDLRTLGQFRWGLYDQSPSVRQAAISALATTGPLTTSDSTALVEISRDLTRLLRDAEARVRREAARALAHFPSAEAVTALLTALHDTSPEVVAEAVATLGRLHADVAPSLVPLLQHTSPEIRFSTVRALGEISDTSVQPSLAQALADADPRVARAAERAARQLAEPVAEWKSAA